MAITLEPITVSLSVGNYQAGMWAQPITLSLAVSDVEINRSFEADLGDLALRLDRLQSGTSYFDQNGRATFQFQRHWQKHCESIEGAFTRLRDAVVAIQTAYDAAAQAEAAASAANNAVAAVDTAITAVTTDLEAIKSGEFNFPAIRVGGEEFVNPGDGGGLQPSL